MSGTLAYRRGWNAHAAHFAHEHNNPYNSGSSESDDWVRGLRDAERHSEEAEEDREETDD